MKTTIPAYLPGISQEQSDFIYMLMNKYSWMIRYAFKRLLEGQNKGILEKFLSAETGLSIRHAKDAVEDARQTIASQHELVKYNYNLWLERLHGAENKFEALLKKQTSENKIDGVKSKVAKRQRKVDFWQNHLDAKSFPPLVFGGKKLFQERCKGNVSIEKWREARNGRISARGDATKSGNPNLRVIFKDDTFNLEITTDVINPNGRYSKITMPLYVARKLSKKTGAVNGQDYYAMMRKFLSTGKAYQVEILRKNSRYFVHISIEEEPAKINTYVSNGVMGIDTNPDGLAMCHIQTDGNPLSFSWFGEGKLQDVSTSKRLNLIGNLVKEIVLKAKDQGAPIVVENLKFVKDKEVSAKFNRMSHSFCYRKILEGLERRCLREGVEFINVHPAYTSLIGRLKYQQQYHISVHQSAALVIARRGLGIKNETVPDQLIKLCVNPKDILNFKKQTNWKQWSAIQKTVTNILKKKGGKLVSWLDYRKELLAFT